MRTETIGTSFLALPDGAGPHPGVIVIHELYGLNENMRDICRRFADSGYAALAVDVFRGRNKAICMARLLSGWLTGRLNVFGLSELKAGLDQLAGLPEVDAYRIGAIGFCMGGTYALTWACTENRLTAIAPFYGSAPRRKEALRRLCPVVGSWPEKDLTSGSAGVLEIEMSAAGIPHDLKLYPGADHSFFNDRGSSYHPQAAEDAWQRVLTFFAEHIARERTPH
jgi:carboxymethylenebutenolidase